MIDIYNKGWANTKSVCLLGNQKLQQIDKEWNHLAWNVLGLLFHLLFGHQGSASETWIWKYQTLNFERIIDCSSPSSSSFSAFMKLTIQLFSPL